MHRLSAILGTAALASLALTFRPVRRRATRADRGIRSIRAADDAGQGASQGAATTDWTSAAVKSAANCGACHPGADSGRASTSTPRACPAERQESRSAVKNPASQSKESWSGTCRRASSTGCSQRRSSAPLLTAESERLRDVHVVLGYTMLGLVAFRLLWGVIGTRYARFGSFAFGPRSVLAYLKSLFTRSPQHHLGHNPAGSWAIYAMLALTVLAGATGYATYNDIGGGWMEEVHEAAANAMLGVGDLARARACS